MNKNNTVTTTTHTQNGRTVTTTVTVEEHSTSRDIYDHPANKNGPGQDGWSYLGENGPLDDC